MCCHNSFASWFRRSVIISLSFFSLTAGPVKGAQGFAVGSLDLGLTDQPGWWVWYNTVDSPEGAFLGTVYEGQNTVTGTVQLGRTLQPGRYYAAWKVMDYSQGGSLDFSIGGATRTTALNSGDFTGQWTVPVAIDVAAASTTVQIAIRRSWPIEYRQRYLLRGLYITTSQGEAVFADDSIQNPQYPTQLDPTPARKGNILENGSFEVGSGHGWGLTEGGGRNFTVASMWDNTVAFEGAASLKVPLLTELVSRPYRLRGNRQFTLSAWVKAAAYGTATLTIHSSSFLPADLPPTVVLTETFSLNGNWQRISVSGVLLDYPASDYYFRLKVNDPQGGHTWVDAVQWEEGSLTDYTSRQPVEVGLVSGQPNNLFYEDEPATMQLWVRNSSASAASVTVPYEIYDYLNRRVGGGSTQVVAPARGRWSGSLNLSVGLKGTFRVVLWAQGADQTREEMVYGVVPRPQQMGLDTSSLIGIHADFTVFQAAALQKLGVKWNRASSPSRAFRWGSIEPADGIFNWSPDDMTKATSHGISVLGTLGLDWPAWADVGGLPDLAKWEAFVEAVVGRYKDKVKYWEIWNEPQWQFSAAFYTQILQRAIAGARRADPSAQIVGLGGSFTLSFCTDVLGRLSSTERAALNSVSTHIYPKNQASDYAGFRQSIRDVYGLPVWNTEAGVWDRGFYTAENSDFLQTDYVSPQKSADRYDFGHRGAAEFLAYGFLNNVGNGLSKYFYYDGRIYVGPAMSWSHPTIFEYDDSIRAKGVVYAVLAKLFDHSVGLGEISPSLASSMYLFDRGGTPLVSLWSLDRTNRSLTLNLGGASYRVYDFMGNPVTINNGQIRYGATPLYIEGIGISVATLRSAVQAGTVAVELDTTPPNLSLVIYPTGPTQENPVKFRWLAIDETSSTSDPNPKSIEYSYTLSGYDGTWSPWFPGTYVDYSNLPSGTYQFQVRSRDAAGNVSGISQVTVQVGTSNPTPPPAPASLTASAGNGQVTLNWQASSGATSYQVKRGLINGGPYTVIAPGMTSTTLIDTTVLNGTLYYYVVSAINATGESPNSPQASATPQVSLMTQVTSTATDPIASEAAPNNGTFTITRSGATALALPVSFTVGGTATSVSDYTSLGTSVTIPAGAASVSLTVAPINDTLAESDKTVVITLANGSGYTVGSPASATVTIQDDDAVASETAYVTGRTLGTVRNDYTGFVGMRIGVGASPITVTALGRMFVAGNSGTHVIKLVNAANGTDVAGGSVSLTMSGGTAGQFKYATLSSPVVLAAGATYYVASQETAGGDFWHDYNTTVTTTSVATELSSVYSSGGGVWASFGSAGQTYGPVNFKYSSGSPPPETAYVTGRTLGTVRNDYTGFVGMRIGVGASPMTVTALGRMFVAGNSGTHVIKLVNAANGSDVAGGSVSLTMSGGTAGQFKYATLSSPVVLAAGATYYVASQETAGGDFWHDYNTTVTTTSVASELSAGYSAGGVWVPFGSAGQTYGPVDFKYSTGSETAYVTGRTLGTVRNDYTGFVGMRIGVGASPITVTALGRMFVAGNSGTHVIKLVNAANGSDVAGGSVSLTMSGGTAGQFKYAALSSPVVLAAGATYYVASQESAGGDFWHDYNTTVTTTSVATELSSGYSPGGGVWASFGSAGQTYGPVDFKYASGSPPPETAYVTGRTLGTLRNDYSGFVGMRIGVGASPITVTALGRMFVAGNSGTHVIKLVNAANGSDVAGGSVSLTMSGGTAGQFKYATLSSPVVLAAGATYYVASQETAGGDFWHDYNTTVTTTAVATELSSGYSNGGGVWAAVGSAGQTYGPVDFKYSSGSPPPETAYVTGRTLGTVRNDYTGFVGMRIGIGASPITVTALGRMFVAGNSGTHVIKLVNAANGSDVAGGSVSLTMNGGTAGQFKYATLSSPVVLAAGATYYVASQETAGGDFWHDQNTTVTTTAVATELSSGYSPGGGVWTPFGSAGQTFGPIDFKYSP